MGKYFIELTGPAKRDILAHKKSGDTASIKKIETILSELSEHPFSGTGQPEALKYQLQGFWLRRINHRDRLVYQVHENVVTVEVVSALGHYFDK
jgi:toxin YoeB